MIVSDLFLCGGVSFDSVILPFLPQVKNTITADGVETKNLNSATTTVFFSTALARHLGGTEAHVRYHFGREKNCGTRDNAAYVRKLAQNSTAAILTLELSFLVRA